MDVLLSPQVKSSTAPTTARGGKQAVRQPRSVSGRASRTPAAWSGGVSRLVRRRELDVVEGQAAVALATAGPDLAAQPRGARTVGAAGHACARDDPQSGARDGLLVHDRLRVGETRPCGGSCSPPAWATRLSENAIWRMPSCWGSSGYHQSGPGGGETRRFANHRSSRALRGHQPVRDRRIVRAEQPHEPIGAKAC